MDGVVVGGLLVGGHHLSKMILEQQLGEQEVLLRDLSFRGE